MKTSLVITTINSPNKNIKFFENGCKKKNWDLIIIGDKKTPKNFTLRYGNFISYEKQKKLKFFFSKICPANTYSRKNIGYLISLKNNCEFIIETDDDNAPKKNYFNTIKLNHKVNTIQNISWINIYDLFIKKKGDNKIWPRGIPLDEIYKNKIKIDKIKKEKNFYLQQGVAENNPDVDAIFRLLNSKIDVKFKNLKISLGEAKSTFNSQNTIWHKSLAKLMYLPVTCTMRCTDIWRSIIALQILKKNRLEILFFGTTMYQNRNLHNLMNDFNLEIPMYLNSKNVFNFIEKLNLKKGVSHFETNMIKIYRSLIKEKIFENSEIDYLKAWLKDCHKL